jgi:hypothetical protein
MARKFIDCREYPRTNCTIADEPELRSMLRSMVKEGSPA